MNRRTIIRCCCVGGAIPVAGCVPDPGGNLDGPTPQELRIVSLQIHPIEDGFELTVELEIVPHDRNWENVVLVGYTRSGRLACQKPVGTVDGESIAKPVTVSCSAFPEIITAQSALSPCNHSITIVVWIGTADQKHLHIPDDLPKNTSVWDGSFTRQCEEGLPPERFLNDQGTGTPSP